MVRKCRAAAEIAVMEVDVRRTTRPPPDLDDVPPSSTSASANKRKITAGTDFDFSTTTTTSFLKLRSRRRRLVLPENLVSTPPAESVLRQPRTTSTEERSSTSPTSDDYVSAFCCSSNGCTKVVEERIKFVDLEDEKDEHGVAYKYKSSRERRETTPSSQFRSTQSGDMESPAGKSEATSGHRSLSSSVKMPAESAELEEFFIAAEKNIQKRFAEKYNYDIVEDVPLEGRYEWIRLKP